MPRKKPKDEKDRLERLPQRFDVWQVDARQMDATVKAGNKTIRPWLILAVSRTDETIMAFDVIQETPTTKQVQATLVKAMTAPANGDPHRPTEVQVRPEERMAGLHSFLADLGIDFTATRHLDMIDDVFGELAEQLMGQRQPGLLDMPGMTPEKVGGFFDAAVFYFKQAPWKKVGERTIQVECSKFESGPWYAILMGQGGMAAGLVLYDSLETLNRIKQGDLSEEENARLTLALAVVFGEKEDLPEADLQAMEEYGWKVAGRHAYPSVYRKELGLTMRPPLAWELELLEGCLRGITTFVRKPRDHQPWSSSVAVTSGYLPLVFAWVTG